MILQNCKFLRIINFLQIVNAYIFQIFRSDLVNVYISDVLLRPSQGFDSFQNLEKQGGYLQGGICSDTWWFLL